MYEIISKKTLIRLKQVYDCAVSLPALLVLRTDHPILSQWPYISRANHFIKIREGNQRNGDYDGRNMVEPIKRFLNYLLKEQDYLFDRDWRQITFGQAQEYLYFYYLSPKGTMRNKKLISLDDPNVETPGFKARTNERKALSDFLFRLLASGECKQLEDHWIRRSIDADTQKGRNRAKYEYELSLISVKRPPEVNRHCPDYFVREVARQASIHDKNVFVTVALIALTGGRPGSILNIRLPNTKQGYGYKVTYVESGNGEKMLTSMDIDLSKDINERPMRQDIAYPARIKKPQEIHALFPQETFDVINAYLRETKDMPRDEVNAPLIICKYIDRKSGVHQAWTYKSFLYAFKKLCNKYVFPALIDRGGEAEHYAKELMGGVFGPHFFRTFFTASQASKLSWSDLMFYRGDKSPESAITYILGDKDSGLNRIIEQTNSELAQVIGDQISSCDVLDGRKTKQIESLPSIFGR